MKKWYAGAVILSKEGNEYRSVFVRPKHEGVPTPLYKLPGGKRESIDDTPQDTCVREVWEETGIFLGKKSLIQFHATMKEDYNIYFFKIYLEKIPKTLEAKKPHEIDHVITLRESVVFLPTVPIISSHLEKVRAVIKNQKIFNNMKNKELA